MKTPGLRRFGFALLLVCLMAVVISAQEGSQKPATDQAQPAEQKTQPESGKPPAHPNHEIQRDLSNASHEAVMSEEGEAGGHDENAKFKYSSMVTKLGTLLGIGPHGMYWVSIFANFAFLGLFFWMLLRTKLPQMFRDRTSAIQKALTDARTASAEAARRLGDIEARLARLDVEVSEIKATAEREAATEEERIRGAAEEDKRKVVDAAEVEISAIARSARHELKRFAASLAVDVAAHKIKVDDQTDHALVREFVNHLGKDGE